MALVHTLTDIRRKPSLLKECGGKGANLFRLALAGFPVPPLVVLPHAGLRKVLRYDEALVRERLEELNRTDLHPVAHELGVLLNEIPAEPATLKELLSEIEEGLSLERTLAVRSSFGHEDCPDASFAGMFDSVLDVSPDKLADALATCFRSQFGENLLDYALRKGIRPDLRSASVVIQQMVDASVSGVIFTMDASGNFNDLLVSCTAGRGEGVVANTADTTQYYMDRQNHCIRRREDESDLLTPAQLDQLYDMALRIEKQFGFPQDIEFSFDREGQLFILQSRPITTID